MNRRRLVYLTAVLAVALACLGVGAALAQSQAAGHVDPDTAANAARAFGLQSPSLTPRAFPSALGTGFEVPLENGAMVWVDSRGRVRDVNGVVSKAEMPEGLGPRQAAKTTAAAFLRTRHERFGHMELVYENELNPGVYRLHWQERAPSGALLPSFASVVVDTATGEIGSFNARYETVSISTDPAISMAELRNILGSSAAPTDRTDGIELKVCVDGDGNQILVWEVARTESTAAGQDADGSPNVFVGDIRYYDAQTGADVTERVIGANF